MMRAIRFHLEESRALHELDCPECLHCSAEETEVYDEPLSDVLSSSAMND